MITDTQFNQLAQKAHILAGLAAVWGTQALFGRAIYGLIGIVIFAAIKEFWYDYIYETSEERGSSLEDFIFYCSGAAIAYMSVVAMLMPK